MAVFQYLTKNIDGNRKEGEIRAGSVDLAIQKLTQNGQVVITLKETVDTTIYHTHYDINNKEMIGCIRDISEDLRDYLRRRGIKIYTDKPFKSIKPEWL